MINEKEGQKVSALSLHVCSNTFLQKDAVMQKSNQIIPLPVVKLLLQREAQRMRLSPPEKYFPPYVQTPDSPFASPAQPPSRVRTQPSAL